MSEVHYITPQDARALLDKQARKYLGLSGDDFTRRYRAGDIDPCDSRVARLSFLVPPDTVRAEVRPATRWERLVLAWRRRTARGRA